MDASSSSLSLSHLSIATPAPGPGSDLDVCLIRNRVREFMISFLIYFQKVGYVCLCLYVITYNGIINFIPILECECPSVRCFA